MRNYLKIQLFVLLMMTLLSASAFAKSAYPETLEDGNLVLVDAHMGVGIYADRGSVVSQQYAPPEYQLAINTVRVEFSEEYYRQHKTYIGGPYTIVRTTLAQFRYNWDQKVVYWYSRRDDSWKMWDINRNNSRAEGNPGIPNTAEVAFVSAYNMRFFDDTEGYNPSLKKKLRVIREEFYERLGI
ncbi:MAG: hypothetical protein IKW79_05625 [Schwartzia sp.]|nr:hypothetical protein [Schwartzia sp. (in: firmicutes)]